MRKLISGLAGLSMAASPLTIQAQIEPPKKEAPSYLLADEEGLVFIPVVDLEELDLSSYKFSYIIPSFSVNLTFNQRSEGFVGESTNTPKIQIQKVEYSAVYQDTETGEYSLVDCAQLKDLRDIFLIGAAKNFDPLVEKFLSDQIKQVDQGAKALRCPEYFGPRV